MTPIRRDRLSTDTATSSMMASDDDAMEESSVYTVSSPPRSASKSAAATALFQAETTPKSSRRLFGHEEDDEGGKPAAQAPTLTPFNANPRRRINRPVDRQESSDSSEDLAGRKRSSAERKDSHEGDASMQNTSPHNMSPNSYITMDGRFVHSKNPFSSPMVTEEESHHVYVTAAAPPFPVNFAPSSRLDSTAIETPSHVSSLGNVLPPRQVRDKRGTTGRDRPPYGGGGGGFLDSRYSFTGSPIPEHAHPQSMDVGSASGGSLQKVRRLNDTDDVVAASSHHFYNRRRQYLSIDTSASDHSVTSLSESSTGTDWHTEDGEDGHNDRISPTDILSFPPPTPTKAASAYPRQRAPPTPVAQRRHERLLQRRTPYPGSILRHGDNAETTTTTKSRFYDDFDVIQEMGKGSFGTVYQVLSRLDGVGSDIVVCGKRTCVGMQAFSHAVSFCISCCSACTPSRQLSERPRVPRIVTTC